ATLETSTKRAGAQTQFFPQPGAGSFKRLLGARLAHAPLERVRKIGKARGAYPVVLIFGRVTLVQGARVVLDHELRPTEGAVVVIPVRILEGAPVGTSDERDALEEALLTCKSPVVAIGHRCGRLTDRA